jgi:hypothetical protein
MGAFSEAVGMILPRATGSHFVADFEVQVVTISHCIKKSLFKNSKKNKQIKTFTMQTLASVLGI